jgi:hypothetical protein
MIGEEFERSTHAHQLRSRSSWIIGGNKVE